MLASASPRRRELLARLGVAFEVRPVDVVEEVVAGESPADAARRIALLKLDDARARWPEAVVLAADTVVDLEGVVLGKPVSGADAVRMLRGLRGREHAVHTAVALGAPGFRESTIATARVRMRAYTDDEIATYVATGDPLDKAGAYAIQHPVFRPAVALQGPYSAVVGLPLEATARLLRRARVPVAWDGHDRAEDRRPVARA